MKNLQRLLFWALAVMVVSSCGASYQENKAQRAAAKAAERAAIVKAIEDADFILEVTQILPKGYPSRISSGEYNLTLKDNVVTTRLPYIGVSHEATFGGADDISIVFDKEKVQLYRDFSKVSSKGEYIYWFTGGRGTGKETWTVTLSIFDSGSASINCGSSGGRAMGYFANLVVPAKDEDE